MERAAPLVAVFDDCDGTAEMLSAALNPHGLRVVDGACDTQPPEVGAFVQAHTPQAIIWNISPPYNANWNLLRMVGAHPALARVPFVVTSARMPEITALSETALLAVPIVANRTISTSSWPLSFQVLPPPAHAETRPVLLRWDAAPAETAR